MNSSAEVSYTVTQINNYIKNLFSRDFVLNRIRVKGEVSNCKYHPSGHIYFTLKDSGAAINCVMFSSQRQGLMFRMQDGQQIEARGQIMVYEKAGTYQLYVRECSLSGSGELYERYLKLKNELEEMGMFDPMYKKPIPAYCRSVGIVTASTGAAVRDIINVSRRRNPYVELILYPALVQGKGAAESIVRGIQTLDAMKPDVIIVGRGGGSIEDLWAFNEEAVARAIFDAETPIISAVGHETDFTIADFVADLRAPTPSAAAELANFEYDALVQELDSEKQLLKRANDYKLNMLKSALQAKAERLKRLSPEATFANRRQKLEGYMAEMKHLISLKAERSEAARAAFSEQLQHFMDAKLKGTERRFELLAAGLDAASPLKKMSGGYGYVSGSSGHRIKSVSDVAAGDEITVYVADGRIKSTVNLSERLSYE